MDANEDEIVMLSSLACLLALKQYEIQQNNRQPKRYWVHPVYLLRKEQGFYDNLLNEMRLSDPYMFYNFTRMSPTSFDKLLSLIGPYIEKRSRRETVSPGCRLAITLRLLATGDYPSLSYAFRVGVSTICHIVRETCDVIWQVLSEIVLKPPSQEQLAQITNEFGTRWSLPNTLGAIDGKHVVIQAPNNSGSLYYNYKKSYSIVLLAVCGAEYMFTYVDIGAYGSQSDGGILNQSNFGQRLMENKLNIPPATPLPYTMDNKNIPFFFVGDEAFPLRMNLMRPYSKPRVGLMPDDKRIFNYRLSRARRVIENSFGVLVARFRIFHRVINGCPTTVDSVVKASVCLHNYIRKEKNELYFREGDVDTEIGTRVVQGSWRNEIPTETALNDLSVRLGARNASMLTASIRDYLKTYVNGPGARLAPWQFELINKTD